MGSAGLQRPLKLRCATGPQPRAKQERTRGWHLRWRMGSRFALGRTPRAVRCKGAGAPGLGLRGRGGRAGGAFKPCCRTALHPPRSTSPLASGSRQQDAVLLGSGHPVPPRLLQGQLVSGAAGGKRAGPTASLRPGQPAGSLGTRDPAAGSGQRPQ